MTVPSFLPSFLILSPHQSKYSLLLFNFKRRRPFTTFKLPRLNLHCLCGIKTFHRFLFKLRKVVLFYYEMRKFVTCLLSPSSVKISFLVLCCCYYCSLLPHPAVQISIQHHRQQKLFSACFLVAVSSSTL